MTEADYLNIIIDLNIEAIFRKIISKCHKDTRLNHIRYEISFHEPDNVDENGFVINYDRSVIIIDSLRYNDTIDLRVRIRDDYYELIVNMIDKDFLSDVKKFISLTTEELPLPSISRELRLRKVKIN